MRFVLGPAFDFTMATPEPPAPAGPVKPDPKIDFLGASDGVALFHVEPYDPEASARLVEISVYLLESGVEITPLAEWFVGSSFPKGTAVVNGSSGGFDVSIPLPDVPPGAYLGQVVYGFDD